MNELGGDESDGTLGRIGFIKKLLSDECRERHLGLGPGPLRFNSMLSQYEIGGRRLGVEKYDLVDMQDAIGKASLRILRRAVEPGYDKLKAIIESEARKNSYHPVEEWIGGLVWDREDRLTGALPGAFGQKAGSPQATWLRKALRGMVKRPMVPGEMVQFVLVLVGGQEKNKSTACRTLAGKPWFSDDHLDIESKDSWAICHRHWLVEFAELSAVRKRDLEAVKGFITRATDTYRKPYAAGEEAHPRRFVCWASTNEHGFLTDQTGNRRFWPVEIEDSIDVEYLAANREQLFAQAKYEVAAGAEHWLNPEERRVHAAIARGHMAEDIWDGPVAVWMEGHLDMGERGAHINYIAQEVLRNLEMEKLEPKHIQRLAGALVRAGGYSARPRVGGRRTTLWHWSQEGGRGTDGQNTLPGVPG